MRLSLEPEGCTFCEGWLGSRLSVFVTSRMGGLQVEPRETIVL